MNSTKLNALYDAAITAHAAADAAEQEIAEAQKLPGGRRRDVAIEAALRAATKARRAADNASVALDRAKADE